MAEPTDRPVSLAAVIGVVDVFDGLSSIDRGVLMHRLRALPTFAPAPPDPLVFSARAALDAVGAPQNSDGAEVSDGWRVRWVCGELERAREMARRDALASIAPTKPPREMPAPEWTGPDRWQPWTGDTTRNPDDVGVPCPDGFVPIGAWTYEIVVVDDKGFRDWRRPLRRVQA